MAVQWRVSRKWIVLIACFLNMFMIAGFPFHMSVLNSEFLRIFQRTKRETALVQAVTTGMFRIAGFPSGQCVHKFGARKMGLCSGLLASMGLVLSFFATSINYLVITIGIVTGCGFSLAFVSVTTCIGEHFTGQALLVAMSFVISAAGCGGMCFPFILRSLLQAFGLRGCLLIVGGIMANIIFLFAVCKPKTYETKHNHTISDISSSMHHSNACDHTDNSSNRGQCASIFKNYVFLLFVGASICINPWMTATLIYFVDFLRKQFNDEEALSLYFWMNAASTFGRITPGLCKNIPNMSVLTIPIFFTFINCCAMIGLQFVNTYNQYLLLLIVYGIAYGSSTTTYPMATMKLVGLDSYPFAIGFLLTIDGSCVVGVGYIAGWILDVTDSFSVWYYTVVSAHCLAICLYLASAALRTRKRVQEMHLNEANTC